MTGLASKSTFGVDMELSTAPSQAVAAGRKQMERDAKRFTVAFWVDLAGERAFY